mmetsp:Transcript_47715/g.102252  ORF Transcript_47715/g.102252 Transcript_47715/m.102252 type:complete len:239 (+) Transcript_47715:723-1439(+)
MCPSGVATGSVMRAPLSWQRAPLGTPASSAMPRWLSQWSAGISGGMSSSSSESSSSSCSTAGAAPSLPEVCMANILFLFFALFFAFRHWFFFRALRSSTAAGSAPSPAGGVSAKASTSTAFTDDLAKGNRMLLPEVSRLWRRDCISGDSIMKAFCKVVRSMSAKGPLVKSTFMAILIRSSIMETFVRRLGTSQILGSMSLSRSVGRKTLMLKVTTVKVCSTALRFCHSISPGPHAGLS